MAVYSTRQSHLKVCTKFFITVRYKINSPLPYWYPPYRYPIYVWLSQWKKERVLQSYILRINQSNLWHICEDYKWNCNYFCILFTFPIYPLGTLDIFLNLHFLYIFNVVLSGVNLQNWLYPWIYSVRQKLWLSFGKNQEEHDGSSVRYF